MRKLLTLFALLLTSTTIWAQTTRATYGKGNGTFYNSSGGVIESGFETGAYFVSNTDPAVTVRSSSPGQLNAGDAANGSRLGLTTGTNTFTISVPSDYIIVGYSFECKAVQTGHPARTLTKENGGTLDIPTGNNTTWYSVSETYINKQSTYFTISTTGWSPINTRNFQITVRKKFFQEEKTSAAELEDGYYVVGGRSNGMSGFWYHDTSLGGSRYFRISSSSSPDLTSFTVNLKYVWRLTKDGSGYFTLQNVDTGVFAPADEQKNKNFQGTATANFSWDSDHAAIKQTNYTDGGDLYVHCNAPGGDINLSYWSSGPGSNVNDGSGSLLAPRFFKIADVDIEKEFLYQKINEVTEFKSCLGYGLHKYTTSVTPSEVEAELTTASTLYANPEATSSQVTTETDRLQSYIDNATINPPATGSFYRFHIEDKYMCNEADGDNVRTVTTTSNNASTVFYLDASDHLIAFADGLGFNYGYCNPSGADILVLNSFNFTESATSRYYNIHSNKGTATNNWSDRNITIDGANNKLAEGQGAWTIENVDVLPVNISTVKWATLYTPVALTIPSGVKAYYISSLTSTEATLTEIETTIAAGTSVILNSTEEYTEDEIAAGKKTYNFAITTGGTDVSATNKLSGQVATQAVAASEAYTLQQNVAETAVGLFPKGAGYISGFKAFLWAEKLPALAKGLLFMFEDADGINTVQSSGFKVQDSEIYNLAGQRINKLQRGVNIVNGKKVLVK